MSPRSHAFAIASLVLAVSVSAQGTSDIPAACQSVVTVVQNCIPNSGNVDPTDPTYLKCICDNSTFTNAIASCISAAGTGDQSVQQELQAISEYCTELENGDLNTSATATDDSFASPTPTETDSSNASGNSNGIDSSYCTELYSDINACWTNQNVEPTAAPVASCLCAGSSNISFDDLVLSCASDLSAQQATAVTDVEAFEGYCTSYYVGGGSLATTTNRGIVSQTPTPSSGSTPSYLGGGSSPTQTSANTNSVASSSPSSSSSSTPRPNDSASLRVTFFTTAAAAAFVALTLIL